MDKLTLEHLAPYLPYGLEMISSCGQIGELIGFIDEDSIIRRRVYVSGYKDIGIEDGYEMKEHRCCLHADGMGTPNKPILRRLSNLTKEIEHKGVKFVPISILGGFIDFSSGYRFIDYWKVQLLIEWHFDVFVLIDAGLAIDINTLKGERHA
ncbi:hypothetical protein ACFSQ3_14595 [Sphingobacterium corticis]|uniref:Uncharacterized protein n=1 Tax=Sphingobacterium corticis TaxID=1812823 RepID=A0ABW5NMW0_9SPHI